MPYLLAPLAALLFLVLALVVSARAQDQIVEKKTFEVASFATQSGRTLKTVKVGWESYGTLNADKSNAVLICHFFSGTSHAAGKYAAADAAPGYWDAIIGPGKAIDTTKYFVLSSDTLVNLGALDPKVVTTGPASIDPDTSKPYGMTFPIVTIRDFVEVQKKLVESLGITRLALVAGASMGALQTYEWAASHPGMVARIMPVIGAAEADANLVAWLDIWASPIRLDPKWNGGAYYGKEPPLAGLGQALKIVTLHAQHWDWANATFARKWAKEGENPANGFDKRFLIEQKAWVSQDVRRDAIFDVARKDGMTRAEFDACFDNQQVIAGLKWGKERGRQLGVVGTPTFFVQDVKLRTAPTAEDIRRALDAALQKTASAGGVAQKLR